jgi:serine/threonine protein kinase
MGDPRGASIDPGTQLKGRYRLERLLGRGGMASVWLATDCKLDRPVAVKVLADTIAADPEFTARFRREARVAAGLSHPNLIAIYDYAEAAERPYLVMEHVPGGNLSDLLTGGAGVDCERLARELLGALAHIHAAGVLHRDVKPQNVLIAPDGSAKLIDFGIALPKDATALTRTGNLLGTARYIAPEVMEGGTATERSDLYSFGVVLRDCLGEEPPRQLRALAERLTAADPGRRPASAEAALALAERAPKRDDRPSAPPPAPRAGRPAWGKAVALAVGLGALAGGLLLVAGGGERDGEAGPEAAEQERQATVPDAAGGESSTAPVPAPSGDDPALGSALNAEGYEMIQAGRHDEAVPVLEEAVRAFPPGTDELDYAYALFNLGNALRLSGRPQDAIPVLERRLRIPDQTDVVRRELAAARRDARS